MRIAVAFAVAALLTACPGPRKEDYSQAGPAKTSTTNQNPQAVPENTSTMNPVTPPQTDRPSNRPAAAANQTVDVQLTEYQIRMPESLAAGQYTFKIANAGKEDHGFMLHGPVNVGLPEPLKRGDTHELAVNLTPGSYHVMCPVDGHEGKGMSVTLTVK